jgi:hypothetical protein
MGAAGGTGGQAVDLGEIRRSGDAINLLAARDAAGRDLQADPALALLGALIADVDTPGTLAEPRLDEQIGLRRARAGWPGRAVAQRAGAQPSRGTAAWLRAAVAGGVVAGLASLTSLIATGLLARLARSPARGGGWQPRHARARRPR